METTDNLAKKIDTILDQQADILRHLSTLETKVNNIEWTFKETNISEDNSSFADHSTEPEIEDDEKKQISTGKTKFIAEKVNNSHGKGFVISLAIFHWWKIGVSLAKIITNPSRNISSKIYSF